MSAFVVSKEHVDALLTAGMGSGPYGPLRWRHDGQTFELRRETADRVGSMLWAENVRSVEHRYQSVDSLPGTYASVRLAAGVAPVELPEWLDGYRWRAIATDPVRALKLVDCFEYQSCETDDWEDSEAFAFCDALRRCMIGRLPGYDEARWAL